MLTSLKSSGADTPPPTHTHTHLFNRGLGRWVQKLSTDIFNFDFGHLIKKNSQTEYNFEMLLIKWKELYVSGFLSKNTSNRYLYHIIRLTVTKTEHFEK